MEEDEVRSSQYLPLEGLINKRATKEKKLAQYYWWNRMIQDGVMQPTVQLVQDTTPFRIVATAPINKGRLILAYSGILRQYIPEAHKDELHVLLLSNGMCIDSRRLGNIARFIRRSCKPTATVAQMRVNGCDPFFGIFANKNLSLGEEITIQFNDMNISNLHSKCACGRTIDCQVKLRRAREEKARRERHEYSPNDSGCMIVQSDSQKKCDLRDILCELFEYDPDSWEIMWMSKLGKDSRFGGRREETVVPMEDSVDSEDIVFVGVNNRKREGPAPIAREEKKVKPLANEESLRSLDERRQTVNTLRQLRKARHTLLCKNLSMWITHFEPNSLRLLQSGYPSLCFDFTYQNTIKNKSLGRLRNLTQVQAITMKDIKGFKKRGIDHVFRLTQLVSLEFWGCQGIDNSIFPSFTALSQLRHLKLEKCSDLDIDLLVNSVTPELVSIELIGEELSNLQSLARLSKLTRLTIGNHCLDDETLVRILYGKLLLTLKLPECRKLSSVMISTVLQHQQLLRVLSLRDTAATSDCLSNLKVLKKLDISDCRYIGDEIFRVLQQLNVLKSLRIERGHLSPSNLKYLVGLASLKQVYLGAWSVPIEEEVQELLCQRHDWLVLQ